MAKTPSASTPKYRKQKRPNCADQAFVVLDGRRHYLGAYGTRESKQAYHRLIAEWSVDGGRRPVDANETTIVELAAQFWRHAQMYYRKPDGTPTSTLHNYQAALRPLKRLYGSNRVVDFTPRGLKAVRQGMIFAGWSRGVINQSVNLVRGVFRWRVAEGLIPVEIHTAFATLAPLRRGRSAARETEAVRPVPEEHIEAVLPLVSCQVAALIRLQVLTAARPGEFLMLRPMDLDRSGVVWTFRPGDHKTCWHGHERIVHVGPKAQTILQRFMNRPPHKPMFSPKEAEAERRAKNHAARVTPEHQGNRPGTNRQVKHRRMPGNTYDVPAYRRAIARACHLAGVPAWHPHQLRHNTASLLRREYGIDIAQTVLGHRVGSAITEIYADANIEKAKEVIRKTG